MTVSSFGNKIFSCYHEGKQLIRRKMVPPRIVSLSINTGCDIACKFCYCAKENQNPEMADTEKCFKLIRELAEEGVESLELVGGGEPTLHPDCFRIAEEARNNGLKVGLITNGARFDLSRIHCFDFVRIGMDADNEDTYLALKRTYRGRFTETCARIKEIVNYRKGDRPRIGLKFLLNQQNYTRIDDMVRLSRGLGVDYCQFKITQADAEALTPEIVVDVGIALEYWREALPDFVYGNVTWHTPRVKCFLSPIHAIVWHDGRCLVCCYFREPEESIGNVFEKDFREVWYSERHWELMDKISMDTCAKFDCRWHYYNAEMYDILVNGKYDMSFL